MKERKTGGERARRSHAAGNPPVFEDLLVDDGVVVSVQLAAVPLTPLAVPIAA